VTDSSSTRLASRRARKFSTRSRCRCTRPAFGAHEREPAFSPPGRARWPDRTPPGLPRLPGGQPPASGHTCPADWASRTSRKDPSPAE
jgi:hypothetical protein